MNDEAMRYLNALRHYLEMLRVATDEEVETTYHAKRFPFRPTLLDTPLAQSGSTWNISS